jgi:enoyl-CoA hydratase
MAAPLYDTDEPVLYALADGIATLTLNRSQFGNAQNSQMTYAMAARIAQQPRMGLALTKQVLNRIEELQGLCAGIDLGFGCHHLAHVHNQTLGGVAIGVQGQRSMAAANRPGSGETR